MIARAKAIYNRHQLALKLFFTALALYLLFTTINLRDVGPILLKSNWLAFGLSLLFVFLGIFLQSYRWKALMGIDGLANRKFLYFIFVGYFFNLFLPTAYGGEALKVIYFGRKYGYTQESIGVNLLVKGIGMAMMWLIGIAGFFFFFEEIKSIDFLNKVKIDGAKVIALFFLLSFLALAFIMMRKTLIKQRWFATMWNITRDMNLLSKAVSLTFLIQVATILSSYLLYYSVYPAVPMVQVLCFLPIIYALLVLPISFGGIGVKDYLNVVFFSTLGGIPADVVFSACILGYVCTLIPAFLGGMWFLFRKYFTDQHPLAFK